MKCGFGAKCMCINYQCALVVSAIVCTCTPCIQKMDCNAPCKEKTVQSWNQTMARVAVKIGQDELAGREEAVMKV